MIVFRYMIRFCFFLIISASVALSAPIPLSRKINNQSSRLQMLDKKRIQPTEHRSWHPVELVAIIGDQRGRHYHPIGELSYSFDTSKIAILTVNHDGNRIYLWNTQPLSFFAFLSIKATHIHFKSNRNTLLICSDNGFVRLCDINSNTLNIENLLREPDGAFRHQGSAFSLDGKMLFAKADYYGRCDQFPYTLYHLTRTPQNHINIPIDSKLTLYSAAFSPNSDTLATLTGWEHHSLKWGGIGPFSISDLKVKLWDITDRRLKERCVLNGTNGEWDHLCFSPDGKTLLVGSNLWDVSRSKPMLRYSILAAEERQSKYIFNADGSRTINSMWREMQRYARSSIFTSDGRYIITSSIKNQKSHICVCDLRPQGSQIIQSIPLRSQLLSPIALAPDGKSLAVGEQNFLHIWPIKDGKIEVSSPTYGHLSDVTALSFGACGNLLATAGKDGTFRLWDLDGSRPYQRLVRQGDMNPWGGDANPWDAIVLSPDGTKLATASLKQGVTIWNVTAGGLRVLARHKTRAPLPPENRWGVPNPTPVTLAFTPDSKSLLIAHGTDAVKMIDLARPTEIAAELKTGQGVTYRKVMKREPGIFGEPETIQEMKPLDVTTLAVSPDGQTLALAAHSEIEIWGRTEEGWKRRSGFWYLTRSPRAMAFDRSGKTLIVGAVCGNGEVRRFDVSGEKPVQLPGLLEHTSPITSVTASSNGQYLAVADEGGRVVVWSLDMTKKLHEWTFPGPVRCVAFAPDGYHLALGNGDGTVYILRLAKAKEKP